MLKKHTKWLLIGIATLGIGYLLYKKQTKDKGIGRTAPKKQRDIINKQRIQYEIEKKISQIGQDVIISEPNWTPIFLSNDACTCDVNDTRTFNQTYHFLDNNMGFFIFCYVKNNTLRNIDVKITIDIEWSNGKSTQHRAIFPLLPKQKERKEAIYTMITCPNSPGSTGWLVFGDQKINIKYNAMIGYNAPDEEIGTQKRILSITDYR